MTLFSKLLAVIGSGLLLATFTGLLVRGRWRMWYGFTAYLPVVAIFTLVFLNPDWYEPRVWMLYVCVISPVRLGMVLELAFRTFRTFPGARATLRPIVLVLLIATLAVLVALPTSTNDYQAFVNEIDPRLLQGTTWIYTAIAGLILWYRLPLGWLPKSVLLTYVPYLLWSVFFLKALLPAAWRDHAVGYLDPLVYDTMAAYWTWLAWRVEEPAEAEPQAPFMAPRGSADSLIGTGT